MDSDNNSCYRIELTVFNSDVNNNTNSNADSNTDSGINCDANSTTKFKDAYEASA